MALALVAHCGSTPDALPPGPPDASVSTDDTVATFAIDQIALGDADDAGQVSPTAWKGLGYDLDGKITNMSSTDVCSLAASAYRTNQADGIAGIDNSFGATIVPIVQGMSVAPTWCFFNCPDASTETRNLTRDETQAIRQGQFTLQIQTTGLSDDPAQTATGLSASVFTSDAFDPTHQTTPPFDESTDWPVQAESLVDPSSLASGARARFLSAFVTHGTFVAGVNELVTVPFHFVLDGLGFTLLIHSAIVTFEHPDRDDAIDGVIAGVLDAQELTAIFRTVLARATPSLCGSAFDGIAQQLAQTSEILLDRSNRAGTPCTGVSLGIGFHAKRIANPTRVAPTPVPPDPCGPPVTDGGADAPGD